MQVTLIKAKEERLVEVVIMTRENQPMLGVGSHIPGHPYNIKDPPLVISLKQAIFHKPNITRRAIWLPLGVCAKLTNLTPLPPPPPRHVTPHRHPSGAATVGIGAAVQAEVMVAGFVPRGSVA